MSKPSPITSGKETRYRFELDEKFPDIAALVEVEDHQPGTVLPAKLVKALEKAQAELKRVEDDLVRWVKYADPDHAQTYLQPLLDQLGPAERAKR